MLPRQQNRQKRNHVVRFTRQTRHKRKPPHRYTSNYIRMKRTWQVFNGTASSFHTICVPPKQHPCFSSQHTRSQNTGSANPVCKSRVATCEKKLTTYQSTLESAKQTLLDATKTHEFAAMEMDNATAARRSVRTQLKAANADLQKLNCNQDLQTLSAAANM